MRPLDTTDTAHSIQMQAYRTMGPDRRTELAVEMSEEIRLVTIE